MSECVARTRKSLGRLALEYGTDKGPHGHNYTRHYQQYLDDRVPDTINRILEIGVAHAASLRMWADYCPRAQVTGLDNDPRGDYPATDRIRVILGDQHDLVKLRDIAAEYGPFDLIVDDGSHVCEDIILSFETLWTYMVPGGLYSIEDLHTSYWSDRKAIEYFKGLVDTINLNGNSGWGDVRNDPEFSRLIESLSPLQQCVESVSFFKSLVWVNMRDVDRLATASKSSAVGAA